MSKEEKAPVVKEISIQDPVKFILENARTVEKPNFTQLQLMLEEVDASYLSFHELRLIMEEKYNLKKFPLFGCWTQPDWFIDVDCEHVLKMAREEEKVNFTQLQLMLKERIQGGWFFKNLRSIMESKLPLKKFPEFSGEFIDTFKDVDTKFVIQESLGEKPNFTQLELMLEEIGGCKDSFRELRLNMEQKFKLNPFTEFDEIVESFKKSRK